MVSLASFVVGVSPARIVNGFVESDVDTAEEINDGNEGTPVDVDVVLKINAENLANFSHDGSRASDFVTAVYIVTPVDFVDFARSGASVCHKIAREGNHGDITSLLIEANCHDGIGELSTIVDAVTLVAGHIIAAGAERENISAATSIGFEWVVFLIYESEGVKNGALSSGDFSNDVITPKDSPEYAANK